jgi:hypothetical protein
VVRHIFQACPVWIYTQSNITSIIYISHIQNKIWEFTSMVDDVKIFGKNNKINYACHTY